MHSGYDQYEGYGHASEQRAFLRDERERRGGRGRQSRNDSAGKARQQTERRECRKSRGK